MTDRRASAGRQAAVAQASLGFVLTSLGACLVLVARDLRLPAGRLAGLSAGVGIGLLVVGAAGPLLLRRGPHPVLRGGAIATAAGCALFATGSTLPVVVAGVLLLGAGAAALILVTPALLAGPRAAERLTRVNAIGSACAVIAPIAVGALDTTGVTGRLALLPLVVPLLALAAARPAVAAPRPVGGRPRPDRARVARRWSSIVLAVSVEFCFTIWAVARLHDTGVPPATAALLGSSFPAGMAIGRFLAPPLLARLPAVPAGGAVTCVAAIAVIASENTAVVTIGLVMAGIGIATLYPVTLADFVATPGLAPHHGVSLAAVASGTAILTAPTVLAAIAGHTGLRIAFLITIPLIGAVIVTHGRRRDTGSTDLAPLQSSR